TFDIATSLRDWPRTDGPRRAGISSFGIGGTNAHVVVEEAPAAPATADESRPQLLVLSARTPSALDATAARLDRHLRRHQPSLADVAFTLQVGRRQFEHRAAVMCTNLRDASEGLAAPPIVGVVSGGPSSVAFMFPGQGAQHPQMGEGLYKAEAV